MKLYFCPECRSVSTVEDICPACDLKRDGEAEVYVEKLLEAVVCADPSRVGMAVDVLTNWLHEPRAITPLLMLLQADTDAYSLVMAARGLGWLGDAAAVPALASFLSDPTKPFVARVAAAKALGQLGGAGAEKALQQAVHDERPSVAQAAQQALSEI